MVRAIIKASRQGSRTYLTLEDLWELDLGFFPVRRNKTFRDLDLGTIRTLQIHAEIGMVGFPRSRAVSCAKPCSESAAVELR